MNNHRLKSDSESVKQLDHMKKQQQLRAMNKPFVPNKTMNADAMIENLLSNKDTFQKKKDNPIKAPMPPSWLVPDNSSVSPFYNQLWHLVRVSATGTATGTCQLADTSAVSSLLMTSGLSTDTLGFIWALANRTVPGSLTQAELYVVLALVSLAQSGYIFNDTSILNQIPQPPIPKLDLTILPQYNMNFSTQPSGVGTHYYQQPNPVAIDSTLATDRLDNSLTTKEPSPVSIVSLDVNKLQGASVLTLPNYNFGMSYQGFDAPLGAVVNNSNKNTTPVPSLGMPVYQEPSSAIPSISLGLSTPTKVNSSYQPPTKTGEIPVLDNDSTSQDISSDVVSFNSINKFKLDSPTKLPSLSQHVDVAASNLSKLNLSAGENRTVVENSTGQTSVDDSFDSLSSERASVGGQPKVPSAPNYNLDLFDLSDEVQHVFPDSGPGPTPQVEIVSNREQDVKKTLIDEDFDDEFTDFQSADFTSFNTAAVVAPLASLPETEVDVTKAIPVADSGFKPAVRKDVEEDDFTNFQEAPIPASDDDLFPKSVTINAPNEIGVKSAIENGCYEKSEPTNYSEWSDNTSNDWTVGSGGNEKDSDSLNYVDLSDIKLEIPTSDTEDVIRPHEVAPDGKGDKSDKEDKYSALRGLQPSQDVPTGEEFGDFLAAEPGEYQMPDMDANNSAVQIRCLEACLQILQESYSILTSASSPKVLSEVMSDPRTINHLTCLLEVFRVSERLIKHVENNDVVNQIQAIWNDILPLLEGSKCYQLEDTTGPVCDLCRCDYGPFPMKYGRSTFHAPCANLYLHYVDSTLPNSEAY